MGFLGRLLHREPSPVGWWAGPGFERHRCSLPKLPAGVPAGLIYECPGCHSRWTWRPA